MPASPKFSTAIGVSAPGDDAFAGSMLANSFFTHDNGSFASAIQSTSISTALRSPFVRELARHRKTHRWCTPSIIPDLYLPKNIDMEYSISVAAFGSHLSMTGLLGDVAVRAAAARFADRCYYSVAGTTTSNHKVMSALSRAFCEKPLLACRNVHHSITHSSSLYGVPLRFLDSGGYCPQFEAVLPPTPAELERALTEDSDVAAVLITSPTYEGVIADVEGLAAVAHKHGRILWVDQAWGSHLGWSDAVPKSALQLGADFATESTHKTGGAMQGASLLLWKQNERTESLEAELYDAHCEHETTSPNFPIIASIDAALYRMTLDQHMVREAVMCASDLRQLLSAQSAAPEKDGGLGLPMPAMTIEDVYAHATDKKATYFLDPMRSNFAVPTGVSAFELASWLDTHGIVCEKNGLTSILFIATYQLPHDAPVKACALILRYLETVKGALSNGLKVNLHAPQVALAHHDPQLLMTAFPSTVADAAAGGEVSTFFLAPIARCASGCNNNVGPAAEGSSARNNHHAALSEAPRPLSDATVMVLQEQLQRQEEDDDDDGEAASRNNNGTGDSDSDSDDIGAGGGTTADAPRHLTRFGGVSVVAAVPSGEIVNGAPAAIVTPTDAFTSTTPEKKKKEKDDSPLQGGSASNATADIDDASTDSINTALNSLVAPQWLLNASSARAVKVGPSTRPSRAVPFWEAEGKVAGETVECYPPGIPVIIPGYRITKEQLCYLDHMQKAGAHIVCTDKTMERLRIRTDVE